MQRYWNGTLWQGERRKPDIKGLRPTWLTLGTLLLALVATWMAIPFVQQVWDTTLHSGQSYPAGWQQDLWRTAFVVGSTSFALALVSERRERRRRSRSGRVCAVIALVIAVYGACIWALPGFGAGWFEM